MRKIRDKTAKGGYQTYCTRFNASNFLQKHYEIDSAHFVVSEDDFRLLLCLLYQIGTRHMLLHENRVIQFYFNESI